MFHSRGEKPAMAHQSYLGIDGEDGNSWTLVQCLEGKTILLQRFNNTIDELDSLEKFIRDRSGRPRLCFKLTNDSTFKLLEYLSGIPDIQVISV
jgi:hypothetical protein